MSKKDVREQLRLLQAMAWEGATLREFTKELKLLCNQQGKPLDNESKVKLQKVYKMLAAGLRIYVRMERMKLRQATRIKEKIFKDFGIVETDLPIHGDKQ